MSTYLVGEQKSSFFSSNKNWNLEDAIEAAQDGDTIEIENGFRGNYENALTITKNITISGHFQENQDGSKSFSTVLNVTFIIIGGANVSFKNIWISQDAGKANCLIVKKSSTLNCENVQLENTATGEKNCPVIFANGESSVNLNMVNIHKAKNNSGNHRIYTENASISIVNSSINALIYVCKNTQIQCENITVNFKNANALFMDHSRATIKNSTFDGGKIGDKTTWMCMKVVDSTLDANNIKVLQNNVQGSLYATNSNVNLIKGKINSVGLNNTKAYFDGVTILDSLGIYKKSSLKAKRIDILGHDNGKINLFADGQATVQADQINFGLLTDPNIKLERNVQFNVPQLNINKYDSSTDYFAVDENNYLIRLKQSEITYFGTDNSASKALEDLIGISSVKSKVAEFVAVAEMNKKREAEGLAKSASTLHSLYLGNPGTGKTTVARIVARLLSEKHVINSDKFVEVSRSDLVANYIGQTATKTRKVLESALGGVLFIDEAYTLSNGGSEDFGLEAIDEILKFMEDHRSDIVLIFAGYTKEMQQFLDTNPGLKSRIPNVFDFEDYSPEELVQIGLFQLTQQKYKVDRDAYEKLVKHNFELSNDHSNGRWVRNLNEQIRRKMAIRFSKDENIDLSQITLEDLSAVEL